MNTGTWGLYYNYTWWGNAIQTAPSVIGKPDFFGSQFEMLTSQQPNQVVNGDFSNGSDNWSVTNADANNFVEFTQGQARLKFLNLSPITVLIATAPYEAGKQYKLTVNVANVTSGSIKFAQGGVNEVFDTVGISTRIINPTANGNVAFYRASADVDITLKSVSLQIVRADNVEAVKCLADWIHETQILDV
jgi:hypothetical protein